MPVTSVPESFLREFGEYDEFIIVGHEEPDGDCLGSQLALSSFLRRSGKTAIPATAGPFNRSEIMHLSNRLLDHIPEASAGIKRGAVILDCSAVERTGRLAADIAGISRLTIDHHANGAAVDGPAFIDPTAPSTTYLVLLLIEALGGRPTPEEAQLLMFGLATDTGYFRHISTGGEETFQAASRLCACGANPKEAHAGMYGNRSLASRRLAGRVMDRAAVHLEGKLLITWLERADEEELGYGERDSDTIYGQLQGISGVDAVIFFREETESEISAGLRSNSVLDVGALAASFGGGGHKHAASFRSTIGIKELEKELLAVIKPLYGKC
jgi:phosphoesterase RecJ-like protein